MTVRQQIVEDRVEKLMTQLSVDRDIAFLRFVHALVTSQSVHAFDEADLVDGGQDKQIDLISIREEEGERADVYIIQGKNSGTFSSNALVGLKNGLNWLFQTPRKELASLGNTALRDKIYEFRALQSSIGPSNIRLFVRFVTTGDASALSDEYNQEARKLVSEYDNETYDKFDFQTFGSDELVELLNREERQSRRVDETIKIRYDTNNPSLIKYHAQGLKGLVCSVPGREIARLVNENEDASVFDLNIRRYLGTRGGVNRDILETCTRTDSSFEFWFLNNGITIVCDSFDPVTDPDDPHVKLLNMQIVNGCQTATSLALAHKQGDLASDVRVLMRVYETEDPDLVDKIVLTTNNQNKISSRDLRANDAVHIDLEAAFKAKGFYYERKPRQFDDDQIVLERLFTNEAVAQWYLAIRLTNPADARGRKYKVWGEHHDKIFSGKTGVEPYLVTALLGKSVVSWLKTSGYQADDDETVRIISKRGAFHIGRIAAFKWRDGDGWGQNQELSEQLHTLQSNPQSVHAHIDEAFHLLSRLIRASESYTADVDRALKSSALDHDVTKTLHVEKT